MWGRGLELSNAKNEKDVREKSFIFLTQHICVADKNVRKVYHYNLLPDIIKIQQGSHSEAREQCDSRLLKLLCGVVKKIPAGF